MKKRHSKTAREILGILASDFDLGQPAVQVLPSQENRTLYLVEHATVPRKLTMAGLERLCRKIAAALGAELYGSVNVDFTSLGTSGTFDMMVEAGN